MDETNKDQIIAATYSLTAIMPASKEFEERKKEIGREITEAIRIKNK